MKGQVFPVTLLGLTLSEAQDVHRTGRHANAASDAGAVLVVELLLLESKVHDIDSHLAIAATLPTGNALVVRLDFELPVPGAHRAHELGKRTPVTAPDLAAEKRIERYGEDAHQPDVNNDAVEPHAGIGGTRKKGIGILEEHRSCDECCCD